MGTELVVLGQNDIMKGGLGLNSKAFQMKPSTIEIVQKMSRAEGAIPGKLRISDTGQHYDEMQVVMLFEPVEQRAYFEGQDYSKDSKLCFSLDNVKPHDKAKVMQAMTCANCPKASWEKYRQTKAREDLPKCKEYWHLVLADRVTKLPYYLNVRGTSIQPFIKAMGVVVKMIHLMKAQGQNPNVFDISFKIYPVAQEKGTYYTLGFKDIAPLKMEDRAQFGEIFLDFANRKAQNTVLAEHDEADATAPAVVEAAINAAVTEQPAGPVEGEIVI
jgi:hypothetical protein